MSKTPKEETGKGFLKAPCKIMKCKCAHEGQDKLHGKGMRVFNPCAKGHRCTVCGTQV